MVPVQVVETPKVKASERIHRQQSSKTNMNKIINVHPFILMLIIEYMKIYISSHDFDIFSPGAGAAFLHRRLHPQDAQGSGGHRGPRRRGGSRGARGGGARDAREPQAHAAEANATGRSP